MKPKKDHQNNDIGFSDENNAVSSVDPDDFGLDEFLNDFDPDLFESEEASAQAETEPENAAENVPQTADEFGSASSDAVLEEIAAEAEEVPETAEENGESDLSSGLAAAGTDEYEEITEIEEAEDSKDRSDDEPAESDGYIEIDDSELESDYEDITAAALGTDDSEDEFSEIDPADFKLPGAESEVFDGVLSPEEESKLYTTVNFPAVPKPVDQLKSDAERYEKGARGGADKEEEKTERKKKFKKGMRIFWKIWKVARIPVIIGVTLLITYLLLTKVGKKLYENYLLPVDPNDSTPVVVTIPDGSGASAIAKILYEAGGEDAPGLIRHKAVFKVYVDFIGKSSRLQAGTYVLSRNMSIPDIVDVICRGEPPREIIKIKVVEGMTIEAMASKLVSDGILESPDRFLELCVTGEAFVKDHPFISDIPVDETGERRYVLEGFLFPDTYEIYVGANEETIIDKMLSRFEQIFGAVYSARAEELGLSMYEIVTLASTIEKEARVTEDFAKVSAVFYNRMDRDMSLDSDATLEYILKTGSISLTEEQLATVSGYNTHVNRGLPLGPVCNPGNTAINAALYPNTEYMDEEFLYFCLMDSKTGALVYAKTLSEHNANVAKYSPNW